MAHMNSSRGVKVETLAKFNLSPSPLVIRHYFRGQLRYYETDVHCEKITEQFIVFNKDLSPKDNPCFDVLRGFILRSSFILNLYNGSMFDNSLGLIDPNGGHKVIHGYEEIDELEKIYGTEFKEAVVKVFTWHLYIRRCTLEFINGGWMNRPKAKEKLNEVKDKYIYSSRYGFVNILEQTKQAAFEYTYNPKEKIE